MENILFIKGQSQYNAMRTYIDEMANACETMGYSVLVLDGLEHCFEKRLTKALQELKFSLVITCNAIDIENSLLRSCVPLYVTYLCDHPAVHAERLKYADENTVIIVCDKKHKQYIEKYIKNVKHTEFIPLSGSFIRSTKKIADRSREIVFTGTYKDSKQYKKSVCEQFSGTLRAFVEYMMELIIRQPALALEKVLEETLLHFDVSTTESEFHELMQEFLGVDQYARIYFREKVIRELVEHGVKVHVFGHGWENFQSDKKENLIIEQGNEYLALKAVADAKISLNVMPWFKAGFQERIATAMLSGAVALTDSSEYIEEQFVDGDIICLYSLEQIEQLPEKVIDLLGNVDKLQEIASNAQSFAMKKITWGNRMEQMLEYIDSVYGNVFQKSEEGKRVEIYLTEPEDRRNVSLDVLKELQDLEEVLKELMQYSKIEKSDYEYLQKKMLKILMDVQNQQLSIDIGDVMVDLLFTEHEIKAFGELMLSECRAIKAQLLEGEYMYLQSCFQNANNQVAFYQQELSGERSKNMGILAKRIVNNYEKNTSDEMQEVLSCIKQQQWISAYNYKWVNEYFERSQESFGEIAYDEEVQMYYIVSNGKRVYYPRTYGKEDVFYSYRFICVEQDERSPHRYLDETFQVNEGDVVIDAGVAEGNFALEVIDKVKKIYLVECEHIWVEALEQTFKPYKDKVVIIEKMLGAKTNEDSIRIDDFIKNEKVNFIKMDVEGAEVDSLKGAERTLSESNDIKCAICAYHRHDAEKSIKHILKDNGFEVTTTRGYMFFKEDIDSWVNAELRKGIVRGVKNTCQKTFMPR